MKTFNYMFLIFDEKIQHFFHSGLVIGPPKPSKMMFLKDLGGKKLPLFEKKICFQTFHSSFCIYAVTIFDDFMTF